MKKLLLTLLITVMVLSPTYIAFAGVGVSINNAPVQFSEQSGSPFIDQANRTQVPFRQTMETFGCKVNWDNVARMAIAEKDGIKVEVPIGRDYIIKNGRQLYNDTAALIKDGRTYLPIRAVLEAFGSEVSWDNNSQTVVALASPTAIDEAMTIHFIDVGQGDSIFIDYAEFEILVDAGPKSAGSTVVNYINPYVDGNLDVVVATHEHADHIGGFPAVLNAYTADRIIDNGRTLDTKAYSEYIAAVQAHNAEYITSKDAQNYSFFIGDDASYRIIQMSGDYTDPNNNSLISLLSYGNVQVLLMGDAEESIEKANLDKFSQVEILKAGHHGAKGSSTTEFLNVIKPETVIVSAAMGNIYKLPHFSAMQRFSEIRAMTYGTFNSGPIIVTTNGSSYNINTSNVITVADAGDNAGSLTQSEVKYIGNSNTKKYHLPACTAVDKISIKNLVYFNALPQEYDACKLCNPI